MRQLSDFLPDALTEDQRASLAALLQEYSVTMLTAVYWRNQAPWKVGWRYTKDCFFLFPIVGEVRVTLDDAKFQIGPGDFLMLPENVHHYLELAASHRKLEQIALHCHIHDRWRLPLLTRFSSPKGTLKNRTAWFSQLRILISILNRDPSSGNSYGEALVRQLLVAQVLAGQQMKPRESKADPRLERVLQYLDQHFSDPALSVDEAAEEVNLSPVQVRKLFRRHSGVTPKEYLTQIRMQEAARLLRQTLASIKEVASLTGFSTDHYFHLAFRKVHGCTPSEFRARTAI